eukprot:12918199-Prorocentrum_lima.AAC.1
MYVGYSPLLGPGVPSLLQSLPLGSCNKKCSPRLHSPSALSGRRAPSQATPAFGRLRSHRRSA